MQFFTMGSSKIEFFETCFYDIMTTQYDHPRYVKHVLARIYVVYTTFIPYFGCVLLGIDSPRGGLAEGNIICRCVGCLVTPARFPKLAFFENPVAPGMGLGDDFVTIRVLEHPWGPT